MKAPRPSRDIMSGDLEHYTKLSFAAGVEDLPRCGGLTRRGHYLAMWRRIGLVPPCSNHIVMAAMVKPIHSPPSRWAHRAGWTHDSRRRQSVVESDRAPGRRDPAPHDGILRPRLPSGPHGGSWRSGERGSAPVRAGRHLRACSNGPGRDRIATARAPSDAKLRPADVRVRRARVLWAPIEVLLRALRRVTRARGVSRVWHATMGSASPGRAASRREASCRSISRSPVSTHDGVAVTRVIRTDDGGRCRADQTSRTLAAGMRARRGEKGDGGVQLLLSHDLRARVSSTMLSQASRGVSVGWTHGGGLSPASGGPPWRIGE